MDAINNERVYVRVPFPVGVCFSSTHEAGGFVLGFPLPASLVQFKWRGYWLK